MRSFRFVIPMSNASFAYFTNGLLGSFCESICIPKNVDATASILYAPYKLQKSLERKQRLTNVGALIVQ